MTTPERAGASYGDYSVPTHLAGTVTLKSGDWRKGRLVFDLDEEWSWEMLDGSSNEIDYTVPFSLVASIEPSGGSGSLVRLRNGIELELEDSHDVDRDNSGLVVIPIGSGNPATCRGGRLPRSSSTDHGFCRQIGPVGFAVESMCCDHRGSRSHRGR